MRRADETVAECNRPRDLQGGRDSKRLICEEQVQCERRKSPSIPLFQRGKSTSFATRYKNPASNSSGGSGGEK